MLLTVAVTSEPRNKLLDSTFGDGSNLQGGKYFSCKKELMYKLTNVTFKGNFEFWTIKSTKSLWVVQCINPNCNWQLRASKTVPE